MDVFGYTHFQEYLRCWIEEQRKDGRKVSFELLARQLGLRSKGHAYRIFHDESMPLTSRTMVHLVDVLGIKGAERDYFEAMVGFNRSSTLEERKTYLEKMGKISGRSKASALSTSACSYFSEWYLPVLREAVCMPGFREDYKAFGKRFCPSISEAQVRKGVELLKELQLISPLARGGYQSCEKFVHAGADIQPVLLATFQQSMIRLASEALDTIPPQEREISTLTFSLPAAAFPQIKQALRRMQNDLAQQVLDEKAPGNVVYQFNLQCFPLYRQEA